MMSLLTQSISNASFGIYFPRFTGTIYEVLSAPVSPTEIVLGYVGAAATKAIMVGSIILLTATLFVDMHIMHPLSMLVFLVMTAMTFSMFGFIIGIWADNFEKTEYHSLTDSDATYFSWRAVFLLHQYVAGISGRKFPLFKSGLFTWSAVSAGAFTKSPT